METARRGGSPKQQAETRSKKEQAAATPDSGTAACPKEETGQYEMNATSSPTRSSG